MKGIRKYRNNQNTISEQKYISQVVRSMMLPQPSPTVAYNRFLSNLIRQNGINLLFTIIKSNTKNDKKSSASFFCVNLESDKIIDYDFQKGLNNVQNLKLFIARVIAGNNYIIKKIFLPKIAESVYLNKFLKINKNRMDVEYYTHKSISSYNITLIKLRINFLESNIKDLESLKSFVIKYNSPKGDNFSNKLVRHYSTSLPTIDNTKAKFG
jgi:hypothetical protein